jgi:RNA polymerase sigma factor (sigma-70 family)
VRTDVVSELAGLRALARSLVRGDADADDLIQDTAVRMLEHPPELDRPVRPWLVTVMLNRWRMDRRSEARRRARELATATPEPEVADPRERAQTLRKLGEAVEALPEPYRNLVIARYFDGKSSVDLAAELGIPAVTVRTRLLRALEKLRKALDEGAPRKKWMRALVPVQGGWLLGGKATTALTLFLFVMMMGGGVWYAWPRAHTSSPAAATAGGQTMTPIRILRAAAAPALAAADPTPGQGRATIDEADIPGGAAAGRVINWSTGEGVAGAELTFTSDAGAVTVKSGDDGAFELATGSPGAFALTQVGALGYLPYAPEYLHSTVHFRLEAGRAVRGLSVFLFPALDYNGRVVDTSGAPVAGARVTLAGSGETSIDRVEASWTTDRDGRFLFHAADMAVLEATAGDRHGWSNVDSGVQITKQMVITVAKVPAHDATITGRVVDEAGKPVADVLVGAYPQHDPKEMMDKKPARPQAFAVSDASGAFELRGLDRDKYELKAEHRDRAPTTQKDIVGGTHGITLAISFGVQLDGAVVSADGAAIPAFTLLVFQRDGVARNLITTRSLVDVAGHFSVRVPPGRYELQAAAAGWAPSAMTGVNAPSTGVKLAVSLGATVRGRVVSAADGTPLAQARVMREGMYGGASALPSNSGTVTRADGTFELRGIPAGTAAITVVTDNFHPRIESGLVATDGGELGPLDLPLTPLAPGAEPKTDYVGIGISTAIDGDDLLIQKVIPGGGAQAAGVVDGDRIVSIDGVPVTELGEVGAVTRIRGLPNTTLALGLRRGGSVVTLIVTRSRLQA